MREILRRTRVVGAFPDGQSALMLVVARLQHVSTTKWGTKRYLQMDWLAEVVAIAKKSTNSRSVARQTHSCHPLNFSISADLDDD
jgi:hypothetical protein